MTARRLHVVDGTWELFRAHYSKRPGHVAPAGWEAKATVGLASSLLGLLHDPAEAVTHLAVAFDNPIRSFRNDLFAGYKSEEGVPPELLAQFDRAEEAARALGLVVWSMKEWEADDALATAAARFAGRVEQVRICSPDKDLGQCVRASDVVLVDRIRGRVIDEAALYAARGIAPASVPDWLALVGDAADGIPGLPGFGERSASAVLGRYGHIEQIPVRPESWDVNVRGKERLASSLAQGKDETLLYRKLATLADDVPLEQSLGDLAFAGVPREAFERWCDAIDAPRLRARPVRWRI